MNLISILKKYYQTPFRIETESGFRLIFYKTLTRILGLAYTLYYHKPLFLSRSKAGEIKTQILKNKKSAFVFANGPSLADIDLIKLRKFIENGSHDLIAVNSFLSKSAHEIHPTFAIFSDNLHFKTDDKNSQYAKDVDICEKNGIRYFVPFNHLNTKSLLQIGYNAFCDIFSKNTTNILTPPGFYGLTALHALRIAKYLGYEKIYLCGFDNSYFKDYEVKRDGEMVIRHRHYYDEHSVNVDVPCIYSQSSEFFFDSYRHFKYIEKITHASPQFKNIAAITYISSIERSTKLDVYK
jgi:Protein of unknown function DUF115